MRTTLKYRLAGLMAFAMLCTVADAQIVKKAQVGFRFLENPIAAEVVGRGGTGLTTTYSSNAVFWNPALLGLVTSDVELSVHNTQGITDINVNAASAALRLGDFGTVGFSLISMDYGTFYSTYAVDKTVNDQGYVETGTFSPAAYALGIAFSQKVSDRFSYGVHVKYAAQDLGKAWVVENGSIVQRGYDQNAVALDVGAYYDFLYHGIRFGVTMQNISRELKYENEAFPLPFAVGFGLAVTPLTVFSEDPEMKNLTLNIETRHPRDFGEKMKYGAEYTFIDLVTARVGYMSNLDERGLTAGAGIRHTLSGIPLRIDYAYEAFGVFGAVHFISIGAGM